jgi:ssDNA-specific exonuclease RecJ
LDINDYKNTRTVQLVLQDARVAEVFTTALDEQKKRYEQINDGSTFDSTEHVLPSREDFACVYKVLRREYRYGTSVLDQKSILKLIHSGGEYPEINYIKLKYILRIFNELNICEIVELDHDIYQFHVVYNATKTNIEKSSILKKLKSQCADRTR